MKYGAGILKNLLEDEKRNKKIILNDNRNIIYMYSVS